MTQYNTINELVSATKKRIYDLNSIIDVLLTGYRAASDVIDPNMDHRQTYIDQLQELEKDLSAIVEVHPAHKTEKLTQEVYRELAAIAGQL